MRKFAKVLLFLSFSFMLLFFIIFSTEINIVLAEDALDGALEAEIEITRTMFERELTYAEYFYKYIAEERPDINLNIPVEKFIDSSSDVEVVENFAGFTGKTIFTGERSSVTWEVEVEEAGMYNIELTYYPLEGRRSSIEREIRINGERPFAGADFLTFTRSWANEGDVIIDSAGNHIRPRQIEKPIWQTVFMRDSRGYHNEPYSFYLEEGSNTIELISRSEPMAIAELRIVQSPELRDYQTVLEEQVAKGYQKTEGHYIEIQGQNADLKSDMTLYPVFDQGDPTVEPYHPAEIRMNSIGGHLWANNGQWIAWEFYVPESGFYNINLKGKQDQERGFLSNRRVLLNGKVPFVEVDIVSFPYDSHYDMVTLSDDNEEPLLFYLDKGLNEIKLEVVLGDLSEVMRKTMDNLHVLNTIYRRVIMVTSTDPDPYRTYELDRRIPGLIDMLHEQAEIFTEIKDMFEEYTGQRSAHTALLESFARLLDRMANNPEDIPQLMGQYRDDIGALGNWINQAESQPLQIDYLLVTSPGEELPRAKPTLWQNLRHELSAFIATFTHDYTNVGDIREFSELDDISDDHVDDDTITVWIGLGRDQGQVLKQMIEDTFTAETGIRVELELIQNMQGLLPSAIIAETAPDVAIGAADMELAFRGALEDLTIFDDFEDITDRFMPSAFVPFTFRESVYGLPETQGFPVMFYRKDILAELGLEVPQTWEDVRRIIPILQRNSMGFGLTDLRGGREPNMNTYLMFLYQKGISLYHEDGLAVNLDSEVSIQTFRELTNFFHIYDLELQLDLLNRFRMGETPLVINTYGFYNQLQVFAPELRGEWDFTVVPGTLDEYGNINRTVPVGGAALMVPPQGGMAALNAIVPPGTTGAVIFEGSDKKDKAWEFLKWWTDTDTQVRFGLELESLMGAAARYATANVEAIQQLPWNPDQLDTIMEQLYWVEGIPPVLGAYYVNRQIDWAFRNIVINQDPVRETVQDNSRMANDEIRRKRLEFGLETDYDDLSEEIKRMFWDNFTHIHSLELDKYIFD
ncbi:extracellular solute-binding protein [Natronospora cellulosivora (SeqCode)]